MDVYPVQVSDYRPATVECVVATAIRRQVPANVLLALGSLENGREGLAKRNSNGTWDFGFWQINSSHLQELYKAGVAPAVASRALMMDGCYGAEMAAYRLQRCLAWNPAVNDLWTRAACYHSKTPAKNLVYRNKLIPMAQRWAVWLGQNFTTREIAP